MGRSYGGILALVAFLTIVARGLAGEGSAESTLKTACLFLFAFGGAGYLVGRIAEWIVTDSVRAKLYAEMNRQESTK